MHGTEESPRFIGDVVDHAAARGRVQLGLEIPRDEQQPIDAYRRGQLARAALFEGAFWHWEDGRSSNAVVALIERTSVELVAFDIFSDDTASDPAAREEAIADLLAEVRDPDAVLVVLSGNIHARCRRGVVWDDEFVPAAARLLERGLPVTTFDVASAGGTYWGVVGDAFARGIHRNFEGHDVEPWTFGPARDDTHHATYRVGVTTASLPARR